MDSKDTKILQAILDGQGDLKKEILENRKRIDRLGKQLAYLEDDAPTVEEFEKLEKRVTKLEKQVSSN